MNGLADVHLDGARLDGQRHLANHVAGCVPTMPATQDAVPASGRASKSSLVKPSSRPRAMARPKTVTGRGRLHRDALCLGLDETDPGSLGVGVGHAGDHAGVELGRSADRGHLGQKRHERLVHGQRRIVFSNAFFLPRGIPGFGTRRA